MLVAADTDRARTWFHRYCLFLAGATIVLLAAGALVTGTGSGLAVPDWPLSFGQFFPPMIGGVLYEHGHRLIAGGVAALTVGLVLLARVWEPRAWVRRVAGAALGVVLLQATLGGMTVLLKLPPAVSVSHACLAQIFFTLICLTALVTAPSWRAPVVLLDDCSELRALRPWCLALNALLFTQLVFGAMTRHLKAGLAIPDFPLVFGGVFPPELTLAIGVHYTHRAGAFLIVALVASIAIRCLRRHFGHMGLTTTVGGLCGLLAVQFMMGGMVVWLKRPIPLTTAHLVIGAGCLAVSALLTAQVFRLTLGYGAYPYFGPSGLRNVRAALEGSPT